MGSLGEEKTEFGRVPKNGLISQKSADLIHHFKMNEIQKYHGEKNWECVDYMEKSELWIAIALRRSKIFLENRDFYISGYIESNDSTAVP